MLEERTKWLAFAVLLIGQVAVALDMTILNIVLPAMTAEVQPTPDQQLWIVDAFSLAIASLLFSTSSLSDHIGRKPVFLVGSLIFGLGSLMILLGSSSAWIIFCRAVMGVGAAMIMPTTLSIIRNIFHEPKELALATAIWATTFTAGMAIGPILGGLLMSCWSWRSAFIANSVMAFIAFIGGCPLLPNVREQMKGKWDAIAAGLSMVGMVLVLWGVKRVAGDLALTAEYAIAIVAGSILLVLFVARCMHSAEPLADLRLFGSKPFTASILTAVVAMASNVILLFLAPQWLQLVVGMQPLESGLALLPMAACNVSFALMAPRIMARAGVRRSLAAALAIASLGMVVPAISNGLSLPVFFASTCLVGGSTSYLVASSSAVIMVETPLEKASSGASFTEVAYDIGNVIGVAFLGGLASVVFRLGVDPASFSAAGMAVADAESALDTFPTAIGAASGLGSSELVAQVIASFELSYAVSCVGCAVMLVFVMLTVRALIGREYAIEDSSNEVEAR